MAWQPVTNVEDADLLWEADLLWWKHRSNSDSSYSLDGAKHMTAKPSTVPWRDYKYAVQTEE